MLGSILSEDQCEGDEKDRAESKVHVRRNSFTFNLELASPCGSQAHTSGSASNCSTGGKAYALSLEGMYNAIQGWCGERSRW